MPTTNIFIYAGLVIFQLVKDLLLFPLWWYSVGLYKCVRWALGFCADWWKALGVGIWLKYLLVPMYGQTSLAGRLISFFMRVVQIVFKSIIFLVLAMLAMTIVILWLALPIIIVWQIIYQLSAWYGR